MTKKAKKKRSQLRLRHCAFFFNFFRKFRIIKAKQGAGAVPSVQTRAQNLKRPHSKGMSRRKKALVGPRQRLGFAEGIKPLANDGGHLRRFFRRWAPPFWLIYNVFIISKIARVALPRWEIAFFWSALSSATVFLYCGR